MEVRTAYPWEGRVRIGLAPERPADFELRLRIPSWAREASITVNGTQHAEAPRPGTFAVLGRSWRAGDTVELDLPKDFAGDLILRLGNGPAGNPTNDWAYWASVVIN